MAFALKSLSLTFLLLLILLQLSLSLSLSADGLNDLTSFKETSNRKLLMVNGLEAKEAVFFKIHGKKMESMKGDEEGWELRAAPLGPDPLHHHGSDPKKPRTP